MMHNNDVNYLDAITERCSSSYAEKLKNQIDDGYPAVSYSDICKRIVVQCVRETYYGYYLILIDTKQRLLFIFLDHKLEATNAILTYGFLSKSDFAFVAKGITSESEVLSYDRSALFYPISSADVTGHIVQEGIIIIIYDRLRSNILLDDAIVGSVEFVPNGELESSNFWSANTPYILPQDKSR